MAYIRTTTLIEALRERLASLKITGTDMPLFERVGVFGANQLMKAMQATFASEARVCFIVPGGDAHTNSRPDALMVQSRRDTRVALLIADRAIATEAALIGGQHAHGILNLKDDVLEDLTSNPLALPGLAFVPTEGEPMMIAPETPQQAGNLGRECWLQWLSTYAGSTKIGIPA